MKASLEIAKLRRLLDERLGGAGVKTFLYQPSGAATGIMVVYSVYTPEEVKDTSQSGNATEIGTTGRYSGSFVADGPGWFVLIDDSAGGYAFIRF